ncbi:MAG: Do family serine endopeptidase [Burkholderiaceae bacterium]
MPIRSLAASLRFRSALALIAAGVLVPAWPALGQPAAPAQAPVLVQGLPDFTGLVEAVGPAVVNIRTSEKLKAAPGGPQTDPNIEELFRRFGIPIPKGGAPNGGDGDEPERRAIGSGFILTPDGVVLTNAHVVEGADEVLVTLTDKREFKAKLIGADARTDVAVVKIDAQGLPFVKAGDVDKVKVGEWVIAIGSPYGLESTVTAGIVSAKQRETGDYLQLLQTDVPINPGNSGGPLINMRGEVVGINSQILSPSGGYAGISLAIPINEAIRISDELRATGKVVRGRIGVQIGGVSKEVAESLGLGKPVGALVQSVQPGLPAEKAGIEAGDIITGVQGAQVEHASDLPRLVGAVKPGSKVALQVFHDGRYKEISVPVVEFEADKKADADADRASQAAKALLGLKVSELTDAQKTELRIKGGVRVDFAEGAAARAGVRAGDIILGVANAPVSSVKEFIATVAKLDKARPINMLVRRGDAATYVLIRPSTK